MDEAEEIYNNIISLYDMFGENKVKYKVKQDGIRIMNEYAQQVSREVAEEAYNYGYDALDSYRNFNDFWDEWIKNQQ